MSFIDEVGPSANEEKRVSVRKTVKELAASRDRALARLMVTKDGRAFIWECLTQCAMNKDVFDVNALTMARKAGRQSVGVWLRGELARVSGRGLLAMMEEEAAQTFKGEKIDD